MDDEPDAQNFDSDSKQTGKKNIKKIQPSRNVLNQGFSGNKKKSFTNFFFRKRNWKSAHFHEKPINRTSVLMEQ
jgi:hypothetical protein